MHSTHVIFFAQPFHQLNKFGTLFILNGSLLPFQLLLKLILLKNLGTLMDDNVFRMSKALRRFLVTVISTISLKGHFLNENSTYFRTCKSCREDNKRPDGMALVPWTIRQSFVWDVTFSQVNRLLLI